MKKLRIVILGSGTLYPAYAGAISCLAKAGYEVSSVCGVSSGALIAGALATGYNPGSEVVKLLKQTLASKTKIYNQSLWSLFYRGGMVDSAKVREFIKKYFVTSFDDARIPLQIVVTDAAKNSAVVLDKNSTISLPLAISISMATPVLFSPVKINDRYYLDGMSARELPSDLFHSENEEVVVLRAVSTQFKEFEIKNRKDLQFAGAVARVESDNKRHLSDEIFSKAITIKSSYPNLSLGLTEKDVDGMISEGYNAADQWLKNRS